MTTSCQWHTEEREPIAPEVHGNMYTRYMDTKSLRFRALPSAAERFRALPSALRRKSSILLPFLTSMSIRNESEN